MDDVPFAGVSEKKREAVLAGARKMFAQKGFSGASIDGIAVAAGVSTRTIYKHFGDKAGLFEAAIRQSSAAVAAAHIGLVETHLGEVADLEDALTAFALAWSAPLPGDQAHFSLTRLIALEKEHVPEGAIAAWQEAGPLAVLRSVGQRFRELGLQIEDPVRAAIQFAALATAANPSLPRPPSAGQEEASVRAGVRTFLFGVAPGRQPVSGYRNTPRQEARDDG